jgi:hypothetical protein
MNMMSAGFSRCDVLVDAIRAEFGGILAERILEAEGLDFLWEARVSERYLGQHIGDGVDYEEQSRELSRIAVLGRFDGRWHVGTCLVDGEGAAVELLWKRKFERRQEAESELLQAR